MKDKAAEINIKAWECEGILLEEYSYTAGAVEPLPKHAHEAYQLGLSFDCPGEYHYRGAYHTIPIGNVSIIHSGEVHSPSDRSYLPMPAQFWMMHLHPHWLHTILTEITEKSATLPFFSLVSVNDPVLSRLFLHLKTTIYHSSSALGQDVIFLKFLSRLVIHHSQKSPTVPSDKPSRQAIARACDYLQAYYANDVSLEELANIAELSRFHFCRVFRQVTGLSPSAYQLQLRIDQAKKLLLQGVAIATVASSTGFYDQSHFGWQFKRQVGVTPRQYAGKIAKFS